ncbi:F-box protein-like protein [Tanacetum coccineum]
MSERSKVCTDENDLPLSVHTVLSYDDLLIEILKRLPLISLHFSKFVSKHWLSLIESPVLFPHWRKNQKIDPPSGFFLKSSSGYDFVSLDSRITRFSLHSMFREAGSDFVIMDSCNGLLLCCILPDKYYVYNPTINVFKMIPQCEELLSELPHRDGMSMRLAFDPTKSPYYKVYCRLGFYMKTYYSETGNWSAALNGECAITDLFDNGIYWKDIIHGIQLMCGVSHFMLIIGEHNVSRIIAVTPFTPSRYGRKYCKNCKLFESCGYLYLVGTSTQDLSIYEMRKRYSKWSLKYVVNLDDVMMLLDENERMPSKWDCSRIWSIVLGEREEDSFLVMELFGKVVQYNIGLKSIREVYDLRSISTPDMDPSLPTKLDTFQFVASSASV